MSSVLGVLFVLLTLPMVFLTVGLLYGLVNFLWWEKPLLAWLPVAIVVVALVARYARGRRVPVHRAKPMFIRASF